MKKTIALLTLALYATSAQSFSDDPNEMFSASDNYTTNSNIRWIAVDNVQRTCDLESKKRGFGGISWSIKACSFFNGNVCDIYTSKQLNMHTLGHEVRHCFQGSWHK